MTQVGLKQLRQDGASDGDAAIWDSSESQWTPGPVGISNLKWAQIEISLTKDENAPFNKIGSASWTVLGYMRFPGSTVFGALNQFDVVAEQKDGAGSSEVRVYDATNGNVVATITGINAAGYAIWSTTSVSNVPTAAAVFEIQGRRITGEGRLAHAVLIRDNT